MRKSVLFLRSLVLFSFSSNIQAMNVPVGLSDQALSGKRILVRRKDHSQCVKHCFDKWKEEELLVGKQSFLNLIRKIDEEGKLLKDGHNQTCSFKGLRTLAEHRNNCVEIVDAISRALMAKHGVYFVDVPLHE